MKVSIAISVYNSHEIVRRQIRYFDGMNLDDSVEIIIVDDGSNPPLREIGDTCPNLHIISTGSDLAWTQGLGRNLGAEKAQGEYLLMTDIDHILSLSAIEAVMEFDGDKMIFPRNFGVLTEAGQLSQDIDILKDYGMDMERYQKKGLWASYHGNTFAMKRTTFFDLGGYDQKHCTLGYHPISRKGEDCYFNAKWNRYAGQRGMLPKVGPAIYMFPIGRYHVNGDLNPKGLFHNLSQTIQERMYKNA